MLAATGLPEPARDRVTAAAASGVRAATTSAPVDRDENDAAALLWLLAERRAISRASRQPVFHQLRTSDAFRDRLQAAPLPATPPDPLVAYLRPPKEDLVWSSRLRSATRVNVAGIEPDRYRHPLDRTGGGALGALPLQGLTSAYASFFQERQLRLMGLSSWIRIDDNQMPDVWETYTEVARRLGVHPIPPLYVNMGGLNAYTAGIDQPFIVISGTLLGVLTKPELEFVLGHELGHVLFDHVHLLMVGLLLRAPASALRSLPLIGPLLGAGLEAAFYEWQRKAELSCDRAGLLACQDPVAAERAFMRLAGAPAIYVDRFDTDAFDSQYDALQVENEDLVSKAFYILNTVFHSHPWLAVRIRELREWRKSGAYEDVLGRGHRKATPALNVGAAAVSCPNCGKANPSHASHCGACGTSLSRKCGSCGAVAHPDDRFCQQCGSPLSPGATS